MAHSYQQIRNLPKEELIKEYDKAASSTSSTNVGINFWRQEIILRATEEQTDAMLKLTNKIWFLTKVLTWLTAIMTVGLVIQILIAFRVIPTPAS